MILLYCTQCAARLTQENKTDYICRNGHRSWNNPRATVGICLIKDGQVLFAKRAIEPQKGKYDIVGGFLNFNEDPETAIRREASEETGLEVHSLELLDVVTHTYFENLSLTAAVYVSTDWSGVPEPQDDVAALEWHPAELMTSSEFAWDVPRLAQKLQQYIQAA